MRRIVLLGTTGLATVAFVSAALAADLPRKAPVAPVVAAYNWTGFYIGGHGGYGWGDTDWNFVSSSGPVTDRASQSFSHDIKGGFGGGQVGYDWQTGQFVFGVEASWSASDINGTLLSTFGGAADDVFKTKISDFFTLTGRVGVAWDSALIYAKGGYANANIKVSTTDIVGANQGSASSSERHSGWAAGGGLEWRFAQNFSLGVEYLYLQFNDDRHLQTFSGGGGATTDDIEARAHTVKGKLNWRFGGPVSARY
jgi:outer membrane immunogenic protein